MATMTKLTKHAARIVRDQVNAMLAAPGGTREGRIALHVLLERNLHDARAYKGYTYLEVDGEALRAYHDFCDRSRATGDYASEAYNEEYKRLYRAAFGDDSRRYYH